MFAIIAFLVFVVFSCIDYFTKEYPYVKKHGTHRPNSFFWVWIWGSMIWGGAILSIYILARLGLTEYKYILLFLNEDFGYYMLRFLVGKENFPVKFWDIGIIIPFPVFVWFLVIINFFI